MELDCALMVPGVIWTEGLSADIWFKDQVREISGVNLTAAPKGPDSEFLK